jgi:Fe-Mn family superoxide dismutase
MLEAKKFDCIRELNGISERTMTEHYKLYEGYVKKTNEIIEKLSAVDRTSANQIFSDLRSLKVDLSFALGGVKNHEIYFGHLGGKGGQPGGKLLEQIEKDFGSLDAWTTDLKASALAARGWVWVAVDHDLKRLMNYVGDAQNSFPIWNAVPILALDVYEHAYFIDYGVKRADYVEAFLGNVDWAVVEQTFASVTK